MFLDWNVVHLLYLLITVGGNRFLIGKCLQNPKNNILKNVIEQLITLQKDSFKNVNSTHSYRDHVSTLDLPNNRGLFTIPLLHLYKFVSIQGYDILENRLV